MTLHSDQMLRYIEYVKEINTIFDSYGISSPRFQEYLQLLKRFEDDDLPTMGPMDQALLGQSLREIAEAYLILRKFYKGPSRVDARCKGHLKEIARGAPRAERDRTDKAYRDLQFQYFVAAIFKDEGCSVTVEDSADVVISIDGLTFATETKRLKSHKQVVKRLKQASDQIKQQQWTGILWIGIEQIINPNFTPFYSVSHTEIKRQGEYILNEFNKCFEREYKLVDRQVAAVVVSFWSWHLPPQFRSWLEKPQNWEPRHERLTLYHSWRYSIAPLQWQDPSPPEKYRLIPSFIENVLKTSNYLHKQLSLRNP